MKIQKSSIGLNCFYSDALPQKKQFKKISSAVFLNRSCGDANSTVSLRGEKAVAKAAEGGNTESLNSEMLSLNFAWKLIFTKGAFIKEIEVLFKKRSHWRLQYRTFKTAIIPLATINAQDGN